MIKKMIGVSLGAVTLASLTAVSADEVDQKIASVDALESLDQIAAKARELGLSVNEETKEVYVDSESDAKDKEARDLVFAKQDLKEAIKKLAVHEADNKKLEGSSMGNQEAIDKIVAANKAKLEAYEAETARVNAENAKKEEAYKKDLEAANRENLENQAKADQAILETASKRQEVLAQYQEDVARVNAENQARIAAVKKENEALEADYQEKLGFYNRELFEITKRNQEKEASYKKALAENAGEENVVSEERYAEEIEKHKKAQQMMLNDFFKPDYEKAKTDPGRFAEVFSYEFKKAFRKATYVEKESKNQQNMTFTKSSDQVIFIEPKDTENKKLTGPSFEGRNATESYVLLNPNRSNAKKTDTPVFAKFQGVDYTIVQVPRGESFTVSYSRKDGKPYRFEEVEKLFGIMPKNAALVKKTTYNGKDHFSKEDLSELYQIDVTYENKDSIYGDGPINVLVFNDLDNTMMVGYSDITDPQEPRSPRPGNVSKEDGLTMFYELKNTFYDQNKEQLIPVLADLEVKEVDKDGVPTLILENKGYIKVPGVLAKDDSSLVDREQVYALNPDTGIYTGRRSDEVKDLESNWRDTRLWTFDRRGFRDGSVVDIQKVHEKSHFTDMTNPSSASGPAQSGTRGLRDVAFEDIDLLGVELPFVYKKAATKPVYEEAPAKPLRPTYKEASLLPDPEKPNLEAFKEPAPFAKKKVEAPSYAKLPEKPTLDKIPEKENGAPSASKPELDLTKKVYVLKKKGAASSFVVKTFNPKAGSSSSLVVRSKNTVIK